MTTSIIIDTDPGQDDAVAVLMALAAPELDVLGLSAVAGNVPLPLTVANALKVCELAGRPDVPVYAGCDRPLVCPLHTAEEVHGKTGLDGPDLPKPTLKPQGTHAVDWLVDTIMAAPDQSITLCPIGPLTNVAMALRREPLLCRRLRQIVLMGGSVFAGGNASPAAEFNIFVDPHAADIVFRSGVPLVMMPLDCTHQVQIRSEWVRDLRGLGTRVGAAVADMLSFYQRYDMARYGTTGGPLHDPCVIAYLLRPDLFEGHRCHVAIETTSPLTLGMTVADWWHHNGSSENCLVIDRVDTAAVFTLIFDCLRAYG